MSLRIGDRERAEAYGTIGLTKPGRREAGAMPVSQGTAADRATDGRPALRRRTLDGNLLRRGYASGGAARKMPGLQMADGGDTSGAPQDHRRISDMPVAAARGRQSVWSCRATRGGHRQGFENAIFTFPAAYSYRGQCGMSGAERGRA